MSGRRRRAIHPPSRRRTTHPPGPRRVPPRHSLRLAVRQLRVLGDQRGAVLPQHAHGHAHARGVERAGAAGGALGDGVLAPDDEARDAGHLDELGQGRLLLAAYSTSVERFRGECIILCPAGKRPASLGGPCKKKQKGIMGTAYPMRPHQEENRSTVNRWTVCYGLNSMLWCDL